MINEISRTDLLQWVNELLKAQVTKIEQLGSGAVYCQLLDVVHPGKVALLKVNWRAKQEYEFVNNFKILQQGFTKLGITKPIEVEKLTKCKYQDNLEFLQWFKKYIDGHSIAKDYDPIAKRNNQEIEDTEKTRNPSRPKNIPRFQAPSQQNMSKNSSLSVMQAYDNKENNALKNDMQLENLKAERDFYYQKFKELDQFIDEHPGNEFLKQVKEILYATNDRSITINTELEVTVNEEFKSCFVDESLSN
ncbi:microtubule integrity protein mal3 [Paramecium bursaria]